MVRRAKSKSKSKPKPPKAKPASATRVVVPAAQLSRLYRCEALAKDLADAGLRADLNPTLSYAVGDGEREPEVVARAHLEYLRRIDVSLRERAAAALVG